MRPPTETKPMMLRCGGMEPVPAEKLAKKLGLRLASPSALRIRRQRAGRAGYSLAHMDGGYVISAS